MIDTNINYLVNHIELEIRNFKEGHKNLLETTKTDILIIEYPQYDYLDIYFKKYNDITLYYERIILDNKKSVNEQLIQIKLDLLNILNAIFMFLD